MNTLLNSSIRKEGSKNQIENEKRKYLHGKRVRHVEIQHDLQATTNYVTTRHTFVINGRRYLFLKNKLFLIVKIVFLRATFGRVYHLHEALTPLRRLPVKMS